jgi:hypothetical protein
MEQVAETSPPVAMRRVRGPGRFALGTLALGALLTAPAAPASAFVLQISSIGFVAHDGSIVNDEVNQGVLTNAVGRHYAPVVFPSDGRVCSFTLIYSDNAADVNITAVLRAKPFTVGENVFSNALTMAVASSGGAQLGVRVATDTTIGAAVIDTAARFYFAELTIEPGPWRPPACRST